MHALTDVDGEQHVALAAIAGGRLAGVGRFIRTSACPDAAELALEVDDALQNQGLGSFLLSRLTRAALDRGVTRFTGHVLIGNEAMIRLLRKRGARLGLPSWGVYQIELPLI